MDELTLKLTKFQADEVSYGMEIDEADGVPDWGRVDVSGRKGKTFRLVIFGSQEARDRALYRITSGRDIFLDNAASRMGTPAEKLTAMSQGRSLSLLTDALIEACGGPEEFSPAYRRWITH